MEPTHPAHAKIKGRIAIAFLCIAGWFFLLPPFPPVAWGADPIQVKLVSLEKNRLRNDYNGPFKHPYRFTSHQIASLLRSVHISQFTFILNKPRPLFPAPLADKIAPKLEKAFSNASPGEIVSFEIHVQELKIKGETFINQRGLNWKIVSYGNLSEGFRQTGIWKNNWQLLAKKGQHYSRNTNLLGNKTRDTKTIIIPRKRFKFFYAKYKKGKDEQEDTRQTFNGKEFINDLRSLKTQYKSKTINRKQYYENLHEVIEESGWRQVPIKTQKKLFDLIDKEHLLPQ